MVPELHMGDQCIRTKQTRVLALQKAPGKLQGKGSSSFLYKRSETSWNTLHEIQPKLRLHITEAQIFFGERYFEKLWPLLKRKKLFLAGGYTAYLN